jgi:predicted nucleic acid-binding protein
VEFVDTNVLLYAYDTSSGARHQAARELVTHLGRTRTGAISVQVMQEFYVNAVNRIAVPLSVEQARARLRAFSRWPVHSPLAADVLAAAALSTHSQISFWDAMIIRSATEMGCARLWSEDLNAGQEISGVLVSNPFTAG